MCAPDSDAPGSAAEALRMVSAGLDYLNSPAAADLPDAALGEVLTSLGEIQAKFTAAQAALLRRFDAADAHDADGYATSKAWLAAMTRMTGKDAGAVVRRMRTLGRHPHLADAMADGQLSQSWALEIADWTRELPAELRGETDKILLEAAAAGADLDDLKVLAACALEKWRSQQPDPDGPDDGFDDRYVQVGTTFGGAGCVQGNLTPECAAAVQAVLESMGKKRGPEDHRTEGQRFHDALQEACELLIRARMVPDRAGADTQVIAHIGLAELRGMPGASQLEAAWLAARAGKPGYLIGKDAEAAACDAMIVPVVTGHPDMTVIDQMIDLALAYAGTAADGHGSRAGRTDTGASEGDTADGGADRDGPKALSPDAHAALRYAIARLAIDFVSGPAGIAGFLRTRLLDAPYNSASLPLDIGYSDSVPASIRRAVLLRDKRCAWPRCGRPAAVCDVHHIRHKKDGGKTSVSSCVLLCQFHHDVCIHRWGWQIILHPDGTTEARGPDGQILRSHDPPTARVG
jgi:Domain of unknown function (DUF222)